MNFGSFQRLIQDMILLEESKQGLSPCVNEDMGIIYEKDGKAF